MKQQKILKIHQKKETHLIIIKASSQQISNREAIPSVKVHLSLLGQLVRRVLCQDYMLDQWLHLQVFQSEKWLLNNSTLLKVGCQMRQRDQHRALLKPGNTQTKFNDLVINMYWNKAKNEKTSLLRIQHMIKSCKFKIKIIMCLYLTKMSFRKQGIKARSSLSWIIILFQPKKINF